MRIHKNCKNCTGLCTINDWPDKIIYKGEILKHAEKREDVNKYLTKFKTTFEDDYDMFVGK